MAQVVAYCDLGAGEMPLDAPGASDPPLGQDLPPLPIGAFAYEFPRPHPPGRSFPPAKPRLLSRRWETQVLLHALRGSFVNA